MNVGLINRCSVKNNKITWPHVSIAIAKVLCVRQRMIKQQHVAM